MQTLFPSTLNFTDFHRHSIYRYHRLIQFIGVFLLCFSASLANAAILDELYDVEVPVVDQNSKTRNSAFSQGLKEVLIRVTGGSKILTLIKMPRAAPYVKQFQYRDFDSARKNPESDASDSSKNKKIQEPTQLLWVQFNETKVNEFVLNNALPLWGKHRTEAIIWLAVNDGANRYLLKGLDNSLLKSTTEVSANRRAIPVIWPQINREEQAIRFADVWAGFERPLKKISGDYTSGPIIIGKLSWVGEQWSSEWTLLMEDERTGWVIENPDYTVLLTQAIDSIADTMGQQFALFDSGNSQSYHSLAIQVDNVNSIVALNSVKHYLADVPMVQNFSLERIENNRVFLEVSLRTNTDDFLKILKSDSKLLRINESRKNEDFVPANKTGLIQPDLSRNELTPPMSQPAAYQFELQPY